MIIKQFSDIKHDCVVRSKRKVCFLDLLRPYNARNWNNIGNQTIWGVFGWMVETGLKHYKYGTCCPVEYLSGRPDIYNMHAIAAIGANWREELWMRMHYVLLHPGTESVNKWREQNRISIDNTRVLPIRYYSHNDPHDSSEAALTWEPIDTLYRAGKEFKVSPNSHWPEAKQITCIRIHVGGLRSWRVEVIYQIPNDGSAWSWWIDSIDGEMFLDFAIRAAEIIKDATLPVEDARL